MKKSFGPVSGGSGRVEGRGKSGSGCCGVVGRWPRVNRLCVIVGADEEDVVVVMVVDVLDKLVILLTRAGDPGWDSGSGEDRALVYISEREEEGVWKEVTPERNVPYRDVLAWGVLERERDFEGLRWCFMSIRAEGARRHGSESGPCSSSCSGMISSPSHKIGSITISPSTRSATCGSGSDSERGTSSCKNFIASSKVTPIPGCNRSILFPTTTQQKLSTSSSLTGAWCLNSSHHFVSACIVSGALTSNMSRTASAPRKNAEEREEKRSWPAVSHIWREIISVGVFGSGRDLVMKSAPIVAR